MDAESDHGTAHPAQIIERHPAVEMIRARMVGSAEAMRIAAQQVEFILRTDPDNDTRVSEWGQNIVKSISELDRWLKAYQAIRDIQGMA